MKCPRCQAENDDHLKFSENCWAPLARACPHCGAQIRVRKKFCGESGFSLDTPPTSRFASPQQSTRPTSGQRILLSGWLEGERKQATVLLADLKGSMALLADRDPEEARSCLTGARAHDGVGAPLQGHRQPSDGRRIMALFGAPFALEDHAVRACYAALAMQSAIRSYSDSSRSEGVESRSGFGSIGRGGGAAIGSDLHMDSPRWGRRRTSPPGWSRPHVPGQRC